jgi:diguanylate cyclase (GGDEF)-like protein
LKEAYSVSFVYRFLTNYEALLVLARFFFSIFLLLFAWEPPGSSVEWITLASCIYYVISSLWLALYYRKPQKQKQWHLWKTFVYIDVAVVSTMVYTLGGLHTDVYYFYYQAMAMASYMMRWNRALVFALIGDLCYVVMLLLQHGDGTVRELMLRLVVFLITSLMFPLLAFLDYKRRKSYHEVYRLLQEKEQLVQEMEAYNRQVAEYTFQLHDKAVLDQLTHLHNQGYFHSRAVIEVEKSKQSGKPISLVMLDIDNFKQVNDTYGHLVGDEVLIAISSKLSELVKGTYHIPFRTGGEELSVLMGDTGHEEAYTFAEYVRENIAKADVLLPGGRKLNVTVSIGVASFPTHCKNHQTLIDCADQAMYSAKTSGKNRTVCYVSHVNDGQAPAETAASVADEEPTRYGTK